MKKYEVKKTITLTVEPGSQVILFDPQYKAAKGYVFPIIEPVVPETKKENYSAMSKAELTKIAIEEGLELPDKATKAQLIELLGK